MQDRMQGLALATGWIARLALWIAGIGLVLMTVIIFAQVFVRYFLNDSLQWAEPSSVMIMAWFIFLGAAVGLREGYHLSFDVLLVFLPDRVAPWLHTISDFVVAAFGFGMTWYGSQLAAKAARDMVPGIGISRFYDFLPLMVGGVLIILFSAERVLRRVAGLPTARFGDLDPEDEDLAEQTGTGA
ncbi:TRAP transporter small permease [Amaricoccus solimangrovi]|uniref:TRAP transporter small permease protein n=1 Tax=Amaricoccus solimangrovi TaxID=2589815 RepID=A0A501WYC5_9RHOB|nr:TRAP transporter small permease [Amaricoccus solimangrovi]TPE50936.1 TRAP transporter small permease [Amaricoccus solimangrovi]